MKLIVDANVLYSGFLRDGLTRRLLFSPELECFAPVFLLEEFFKYFAEFSQRSGANPRAVRELTARIVRRITFIEKEELMPYAAAAS
ncbi:MAG: PIN domain-containing protein, partial [Candidatus Micrarchaeota archaeon]|nr:PIN domain-containing protein [Candidatus Micrarchaeota archaeon]